MTGPRVLLVANTSWYLANFRIALIRALRAEGLEVALAVPLDDYSDRLEAEGFLVHPWPVARRSLNPLLELRALLALVRLYRQERPALVHHFTIKACLYGTIAAKLAGVPHVINAVTGLGHVFLGTRKRSQLLRRLLQPLYRAVFRARRVTVVFQNAEDRDTLIALGITEPQRARLIRSSGVDINHFAPMEPSAGSFHTPVRVLFPSRLIHEKGVSELLSACRQLWTEGERFELLVAGALDAGNRSSLSAAELAAITADPRVRCLGHVHDMRKLYASCDLVVLPSWREGLSRALIEAAAMERPIITTNVPGCRDVVDHGRSGLLVPLQDAEALALAIQLLLHNPELAARLGRQARKKVTAEFQVSLVNDCTLQQYRRLLGAKTLPGFCSDAVPQAAIPGAPVRER